MTPKTETKENLSTINKSDSYAYLIIDKLKEIVEQPEFKAEMQDSDNRQQFFHALSNIVPYSFYQEMTQRKDMNVLDFNHLANMLIFKYSD